MWSSSGYGHSTIVDTLPEFSGNVDYALSEPLFDRKYHTLIPDKVAWSVRVPGDRRFVSFYTDGSKLGDRVGLGVFSGELGLSIARRLPDHCSVFQAEILAIRAAVDWLRYNVLTKVGVNIYSDSQAAIKSLSNVFLTSRSALDCRRSLNEMAEQFKIHLIWMPGHRDIPGNCRADELARLGTTLHVKRRAFSTAKDRWSMGLDGFKSKLVWPRLNMRRTKALLSLNRPDVALIVAVVTGHRLIGEYARRLRVSSNDFCRSCGYEEEEESVEHLLCKCPALSIRRNSTLGSFFFDELGQLADVNIRQLLGFIKRSNWFDGRD